VRRLGLAAVAGSGFRGADGIDVGDCHTLVDADVRSARDLAVAIRVGRVEPVFGPPAREAKRAGAAPASRELLRRPGHLAHGAPGDVWR